MSQVGDDCYFFYYSNCTKGFSCAFRHVEAALGNEVVCKHWQMGSCTRPGCRFRHMDIQTDRSKTACFWETQPSGCTKPHCVFKHFKPRPVDGLSIDEALPSGPKTFKNLTFKAGSNVENVGSNLSSDLDAERASPKIEPVIVNPLEDDSECESVQGTPQKKIVVTRPEQADLSPEPFQTNVILKKAKEPLEKLVKVTNAKSAKPIKRKIKLLDNEVEETDDALFSQSEIDLFQEADTRRNVVIGDDKDDSLGENFQDFLLKKSKSSLGISVKTKVPEKSAGVKKRLGHVDAHLSTKSKPSVKKRLGRVEADQFAPVKVSILDRLGGVAPNKESSPERGNVKRRLGLVSASAKLGLKSLEELRSQKLKLQKELDEVHSEEEKEEDDDDDDDDESDEISKAEPLTDTRKEKKQKVQVVPDAEDEKFLTDIKVKSLAEIRADKAKKANARKSEVVREETAATRKKKAVLPPAKAAPKRKIMVYTELFEDADKESPPPVEPAPGPAVKVKSLEDIRAERAKKKAAAVKKERQIYMPPAMKHSVKVAPVKTSISPPPKETKEEPTAKVKPAADVKTFSEIMAEKRRKQLELRAKQEAAKAEKAKSAFRVKSIVFDTDEAEKSAETQRKNENSSLQQTANPLRSKTFQSKENVSVNSSAAEPSSLSEIRLLEGTVLASNTSSDNVIDVAKTERLSDFELDTKLESPDKTSPTKRRTSSQGSDMPTKKKSRQSLLNEDEDDFFFGDDLDDFEDAGKIDEGDLLQDIDELLA